MGEADSEIDRTLQLWPQHFAVRYARLLIFALTGRVDAARSILDAGRGEPAFPSPRVGDTWRALLQAQESGTPADRTRAVAASLAIATGSPGSASNALLCLAALGALDEAFSVAEGLLLRRGSHIVRIPGLAPPPTVEQRWRKTMMLWMPSGARMRADPRFAALMQDCAIADYWRRTGTGPDAG